MPVYKCVSKDFSKSKNLFLALDPTKPLAPNLPKFAAKLSIAESAAATLRLFACAEGTDAPEREMDPAGTLADNGVEEKACIYVALPGDPLPDSVKKVLSTGGDGGAAAGAETTPAPSTAAPAAAVPAENAESIPLVAASAATSRAAAADALVVPDPEEQQKKKDEEETAAVAAAAAAAAKQKVELEAAQQAEAAAAAAKKKAEEELSVAAAAAAQKNAQQDAVAAAAKKKADEEAEKSKGKKDADSAYEASRKQLEDENFKRQLDARETERRRSEREEADRRRAQEDAAAARRAAEWAAREQREQEQRHDSLTVLVPQPIPRVDYTHRALSFEMLFMQEELERYKMMFFATRELYSALTATNLMSRSWHVSEKTPMIESMRLYSKTLNQRLAMMQSAVSQRQEVYLQSAEIQEGRQRELITSFRDMQEDAVEQLIQLRAIGGKASNDAHQHYIRRMNAEQSQFVALEKLRMEEHQLKYTTERLEETQSRLKDVETRNEQLIAMVEHLGNNLLRRNTAASGSSSSSSSSPRSVGVLLSDTSTAQTTPGSTSVVHCIDDVPDHVMSTAVQLERRWAEKDEKIRELQSALTTSAYKNKESVERQKESESQRDIAMRNNTAMQAALKEAHVLAKTWEARCNEAERKVRAAEAESARSKDALSRAQADLRSSEAKADASEAALTGVQLDRERIAEHVERLKGEMAMVRREVEAKHALIVNLETRETTMRNSIEPTERRVRDLTRSLEHATLLTQKLQKELDKRDQALQRLRGHLHAVGMLPSQTAQKFSEMAEADRDMLSEDERLAMETPTSPLQYLQQQQQIRRQKALLEEGAAESTAAAASSSPNSQQQQQQQQQLEAVYHNKPLGYLGRPSAETPRRGRSPAAGTHHHSLATSSGAAPPKVSSLDIAGSINRTRSTPSQQRSPFRASPSTPTANRQSTTRQHFTSKFQDIMELADAHVQNITCAHSAIGNRAISAAAGTQIAAVLERLQRALTDTEIELQRETSKRVSLEEQLATAKRGVEEMMRINIEIREKSQSSVEDAINFFAGAGGENMRNVVQEVYATKNILLENETLKMRFDEQSKRVRQLEVRCQVLERHLEALARGGSAGIDAVVLRGGGKKQAGLGTADEHSQIEMELHKKAEQIAKEARRRERRATMGSAVAAAGDDPENSDFDENQFQEDPQLLELIRHARKGKAAAAAAAGGSGSTNNNDDAFNSLDAVLRVAAGPRSSTPPSSASRSRARGASVLDQTRHGNAVAASEMARLRAAAVREQNAELERKIKKLDEWRSAILDQERIAVERGAAGTGAGRATALQAADRLAHTPPRQLRSGRSETPPSQSPAAASARRSSPGPSIPKANRTFNFGAPMM